MWEKRGVENEASCLGLNTCRNRLHFLSWKRMWGRSGAGEDSEFGVGNANFGASARQPDGAVRTQLNVQLWGSEGKSRLEVDIQKMILKMSGDDPRQSIDSVQSLPNYH